MTSLNTDPELYGVAGTGDECLACYASGETPLSLFFTFSGMQSGDDWLPGDPPPPNGIWAVPHTNNCVYTFDDGTWTLLFNRDSTSSFTQWKRKSDGRIAFFGFGATACLTDLDNSLASAPGRIYYGGSLNISSMVAAGSSLIIQTMDEIVVPQADQTFANPGQIDKDNSVVRLFRGSDATNIHVLTDTS